MKEFSVLLGINAIISLWIMLRAINSAVIENFLPVIRRKRICKYSTVSNWLISNKKKTINFICEISSFLGGFDLEYFIVGINSIEWNFTRTNNKKRKKNTNCISNVYTASLGIKFKNILYYVRLRTRSFFFLYRQIYVSNARYETESNLFDQHKFISTTECKH